MQASRPRCGSPDCPRLSAPILQNLQHLSGLDRPQHGRLQMNLPPPRIRIRTLLVLIAVCAVLFRVGQETWGDKTERWLATLQSDHSERRRKEAASSLAENANRVDPDLAMPTLTAALKDRNVEVRRSVVAVLFQLGVRSDSAIPVLVQAIKDEDVIACIMTVEGLGDCVKMDQRREIVIAALIRGAPRQERHGTMPGGQVVGQVGSRREGRCRDGGDP